MRSEERVQQEHSIYVLFCFGVLLRQSTRKYQDVTLTPAVFKKFFLDRLKILIAYLNLPLLTQRTQIPDFLFLSAFLILAAKKMYKFSLNP